MRPLSLLSNPAAPPPDGRRVDRRRLEHGESTAVGELKPVGTHIVDVA